MTHDALPGRGARLRAGWAALVDLVLPATCGGCGVAGTSWCPRCAAALAERLPAAATPSPRPPGLPPVTAAGEYAGPLREAIVAYKERGRHALAAVLGDRLATAAAVAATHAGARGPRGRLSPVPVLLIPVPATAAAIRRRHGDHMVRLARRAASALNRRGVPAAVAYPLRARRRPDFAGLSAAQRRHAAAGGFAVRRGRLAAVRAAAAAGVLPVLVDDVMTTGATLSAAAQRLRADGLPVPAVAVLAATRRRSG